ncbi:MAG TPA: LamG domain-containing protein, partial [Terriglobales bacterium]|nr:LamG domain-containing protein [Terriglobales bacterium]
MPSRKVLFCLFALALIFTCTAAAKQITTSLNVPLNERVQVTTGTYSEFVKFTGSIHTVVKVGIPIEPCYPTDPCRSVPYDVHINLQGVSGVGETSGLRYIANGATSSTGLTSLPGGFSFTGNFRVIPPTPVIPPSPIIPPSPVIPIGGFITLAADGTASSGTNTTGLVSYWQGEGDASDSMGVNPGTIDFAVGFDPNGRLGQAFNFSGDGWIEVAQSASLETQTVTLAAWVKRSNPAQSAALVVKGGAACDGDNPPPMSYGLLSGPNGEVFFRLSDNVSPVSSPSAPASAVWDGNWHLLAGTYDGTNVSLYLDGTLVGSAPGLISPVYYGYSDPRLYFAHYNGATC